MIDAHDRQSLTVTQALQQAFLEPNGQASLHGSIALGHLRKFCFAIDSTVKDNEQASGITIALREGRRQVWLEIEQMLKLSPQELAAVDRQYQSLMAETGRN